ncbi:MAG: omptin family outer membrane protease [Treponema sp.]|nr:omptin family outer membrane protease [Treponema sp.]
MKSIAVLAVFVIIAAGPVHAEERRASAYTFSLNGEWGFLYGSAYEIVYDSPSARRYLSELQWNIKPLFFAGLSLEFGPRDPSDRIAFFAELKVKAGLPGKTGVMEDRDWFPNVPVAPGSLTHFSSHENHTKAAFFADIGGGVSFPLGKKAAVKMSLYFSYMFFKYEARNGYTQYGGNPTTTALPCSPWDPSFPKVSFSGLGVDYTQHWFILSPGIALVVPGKRISFSVSAALSPAVACAAFDNHFTRNLLVNELMFGGIFFEPEGSFFFSFSESMRIGLSVSYRHIGGTRGDRYDTDTSTGIDTPWMRNVSGAGYRAFQGKAAFKITF